MEIGDVLAMVHEEFRALNERLDALEQKIDHLVAPPKALTVKEATRHLPVGETTIKAMIACGEIRTVRMGNRRGRFIPLEEIIRLTSVAEPVRTAPSVAEHRKASARARAKAEAAEILAFAKTLRKR